MKTAKNDGLEKFKIRLRCDTTIQGPGVRAAETSTGGPIPFARRTRPPDTLRRDGLIEGAGGGRIHVNAMMRVGVSRLETQRLHPTDLRAKLRFDFAGRSFPTQKATAHFRGANEFAGWVHERTDFFSGQDRFALGEVEVDADAQFRNFRRTAYCVFRGGLVDHERGTRQQAFAMRK